MRPFVRPVLALAQVTFWGSLRGFRGLGLLLIALLPTFAVGGLAADGISGTDLVGAYEAIELDLALPLGLLLITLLLAVPLLREDIDDRSISYLMSRTLGKPAIILGKYLGYLGASSLILLPTTALAYGVIWGSGQAAPGELNGVLPALLVATVLGILAYGAVYLVFGVLTRHALIFGLFYGFLWEYLIGTLAGLAPDLSIMHYLLSLAALWSTYKGGPFQTYPTALTVGEAVGVPLAVTVVALVLALIVLQLMDLTAPAD